MELSQRECQSHISVYFLLFSILPSLPHPALLSSPPLSVCAKDLSGFHLFVGTLFLSPFFIFSSWESLSVADTLLWRNMSHVWPCSTNPGSLHISPVLTTDATPYPPPLTCCVFSFLFFTPFIPHFTKLLSFYSHIKCICLKKMELKLGARWGTSSWFNSKEKYSEKVLENRQSHIDVKRSLVEETGWTVFPPFPQGLHALCLPIIYIEQYFKEKIHCPWIWSLQCCKETTAPLPSLSPSRFSLHFFCSSLPFQSTLCSPMISFY